LKGLPGKILRHGFERVVAARMAAGLVKGEGFAADASVMEATASRYHGKAPDDLDWTDGLHGPYVGQAGLHLSGDCR
jgi:hypothetical protein